MLVPVSTEHLEAPYLRSGTNMLADAGTHVVVTDAHQTDCLRGIFWQTIQGDALRQFITRHELKGDGQIFLNQLIHPAFDFLLLLP